MKAGLSDPFQMLTSITLELRIRGGITLILAKVSLSTKADISCQFQSPTVSTIAPIILATQLIAQLQAWFGPSILPQPGVLAIPQFPVRHTLQMGSQLNKLFLKAQISWLGTTLINLMPMRKVLASYNSTPQSLIPLFNFRLSLKRQA